MLELSRIHFVLEGIENIKSQLATLWYKKVFLSEFVPAAMRGTRFAAKCCNFLL